MSHNNGTCDHGLPQTAYEGLLISGSRLDCFGCSPSQRENLKVDLVAMFQENDRENDCLDDDVVDQQQGYEVWLGEDPTTDNPPVAPSSPSKLGPDHATLTAQAAAAIKMAGTDPGARKFLHAQLISLTSTLRQRTEDISSQTTVVQQPTHNIHRNTSSKIGNRRSKRKRGADM